MGQRNQDAENQACCGSYSQNLDDLLFQRWLHIILLVLSSDSIAWIVRVLKPRAEWISYLADQATRLWVDNHLSLGPLLDSETDRISREIVVTASRRLVGRHINKAAMAKDVVIPPTIAIIHKKDKSLIKDWVLHLLPTAPFEILALLVNELTQLKSSFIMLLADYAHHLSTENHIRLLPLLVSKGVERETNRILYARDKVYYPLYSGRDGKSGR